MEELKRIKGIEKLLEQMPPEYCHWHLFGSNIRKLEYEKYFDTFKSKECCRIKLILTDKDERFYIMLVLENVIGDVHFDCLNGFFSGFHIEDKKLSGWEAESGFRITSTEQDIDFELFCEEISVELVKG